MSGLLKAVDYKITTDQISAGAESMSSGNVCLRTGRAYMKV